MNRLPLSVALLAATLVASACGSSPDYDKLEASITKEIDSAFVDFDTTVTAVECPEQESLGAGDQFTCTVQLTDLDDEMRVVVDVVNDDLDVTFETLDLLYDMRKVETTIATDLIDQVGGDVQVDCGEERLQAIEGGAPFTCRATDAEGSGAVVDVTTDTEGTITWTVTPDET